MHITSWLTIWRLLQCSGYDKQGCKRIYCRADKNATIIIFIDLLSFERYLHMKV